MLNCHVRYSVYKTKSTPCGTIRERVQPDETHEFDAKSKWSAKRKATQWGSSSVFGKATWHPQDYNFIKSSRTATIFVKCVEDDGLDIFLTLQIKEAS